MTASEVTGTRVPKSKHRRKNKSRPRPKQIEQAMAPPARRESPAWIPRVGIGAIAVGLAIILLGYLDPVANFLARNVPGVGANISLILGFVLLLGGMVVLTRWE